MMRSMFHIWMLEPFVSDPANCVAASLYLLFFLLFREFEYVLDGLLSLTKKIATDSVWACVSS